MNTIYFMNKDKTGGTRYRPTSVKDKLIIIEWYKNHDYLETFKEEYDILKKKFSPKENHE